MAEYRANPVLFVRQAIGVDPTPHQIQTLESVKDHARTSIKSGHGTGKSSGAAFLVWWYLCCFPHSRVPCTAPTMPQLQDVLWAEIAKWGNELHPWFRNQFEISSEKVFNKEHPKTWFAVARTARKENPDALQGFHGDNLLFIVDEASGVPSEIFLPVEGALTGKHNRILIQGNPTQTTGYLFESHNKQRSRWNALTFNSEDSPLVDKAFCEGIEQGYGKDSDIYRVRVLGEFPGASINQLISRDLIDAASGKAIRPEVYRHAAKVLGVDVARMGDDQTVIIRRQGLAASDMRKFKKFDLMQVAGFVAQEIETWQPDATFVDVGGMGAGVVDRLRQLGHDIIEVNFGAAALHSDRHYNLRTEMWVNVREWLKAGGVLPPDDELASDLAGPQYGFDAKQRIQLERKEDMKRRGLASPDCGDALALTFAMPVSPAAMALKADQAHYQYDPLEYAGFGGVQ